MEGARQRTVDYLQPQAGSIVVQSVKLDGGKLTTEIAMRNTAVHQFRTSYPSRRAWIHLVITDAQGKVVFESGGSDTRDMILENDNDLDPVRLEPHYTEIHRFRGPGRMDWEGESWP